MNSECYNERFSPEEYYLLLYSKINDFNEPPLQELDKFYAKHYSGRRDLKVLDYGCGPVIAYVISAAQYAKEIVFAEYTLNNRRAIEQWVAKDPRAFNWSHVFEYVVKGLEKKTEEQARERQEQLRRIVKGVVTCDILAADPIERGYEGPYDVIITSLCLENPCTSHQQYVDAVGKLKSMLKPGGRIVMYSTERDMSDGKLSVLHTVGNEKFHNLRISQKFLLDTLKQHNFNEIELRKYNFTREDSELIGTMFATAKF